MKRRFASAVLLAVIGWVLVGCEGDQVVKAPPTRPQGVGASRGTAANGAPPPAANEAK